MSEGARSTVDSAEVARFDALARDWWDPDGPTAALHRINPLRLRFILEEVCGHFAREPRKAFPFDGLRVLDIGCGAGLLSEPMARLGGQVTALDPAAANIAAARHHAEGAGLQIDYRADTVETVSSSGAKFDVVLAMEVVEHVADMEAFVSAAGAAVAPGGLVLMATINRTLRSFALAIVGAEYILRWLPRGTHDWEKFVTPDELTDAILAAGLRSGRTRGMGYNPPGREGRLAGGGPGNYPPGAAKPASPPAPPARLIPLTNPP